MNKSELRDLALLGVRRKIEELERQIARYHQEFPELFISQTTPVMLRAEEKPEGGTWAIPAPQKPRKLYVQTAAHRRAVIAANRARATTAPTLMNRIRATLGSTTWKLRDLATAAHVTPRQAQNVMTRLQQQGTARQVAGRRWQATTTKAPKTAGARASNVTAQVATYLRTEGPARAVTIQRALKVKAKTSISSALARLEQRGHARRRGNIWSLTGTGTAPRARQNAGTNGAWGTRVWQQVHDAITAQGGRATMQQITKAIGKKSATVISSITPHLKTGVFTRVDKGVYTVTARPAQEAP